MYILLALVATALTSMLPILNKRLLQDAPPAWVAWTVNAASLPLLTLGTAILTQCGRTASAISCSPRVPSVDGLFALALLGSAALNWIATLLSTHALASADASLVSPLLTFNPAFTLLVAWLLLSEVPSVQGVLGVALILLGAYLLEAREIRTGLLAPLRMLLHRPGTTLAIAASACWGITTVLEKVAIEHVAPPSGPLVALASTALTVVLLTPGALRVSPMARQPHVDMHRMQRMPAIELNQAGAGDERSRFAFARLMSHRGTLLLAALIAGVAPLFGFSAIALGFVGYVTALFKLSAVLTILWAHVVLGEGGLRERLLGAAVMVAGAALVAA